MTSKTVAIVCLTPAMGGLELNLIKLSRWLMDRGCKVHFLCLKDSAPAQKAKQYGVPTVFIQRNRKYFDFKTARAVKKICLENKISNIVCSDNHDLDLILWVKFLMRGKLNTLYLQQMQIGINKKDPIHALKYKWLDYWFAPLEWLKKQASERTHIDPKKVILCPLGVDIQLFSKNLNKSDMRSKYNLPQNLFLFGFVGRTDPGKGLHTILDAFDQVASENEQAGLFVVSAFPKEGQSHYDYFLEIEKKRESSPYKDRIFFHPFVDSVQEVFRCMDVFIMASLVETVGMVTIEAMLSQTPVLGANSAGTPELLDHGRAGLLFKVEDSEDLSRKMREAQQYPARLSDMLDLAKHRAEENYSADRMCSVIINHLN